MIKVNGKLLDLGLHKTARDAAVAAANYKRTHDGGLLRQKGWRRRVAVSVTLGKEVAHSQRWKCAGFNGVCPLPNRDGNLPAEYEIDHVNGDRSDSRVSNLQALCGICHNVKTSWERKKLRATRSRARQSL